MNNSNFDLSFKPNDATPTISGFNYQGKVAIFSSLLKINNLKVKHPKNFTKLADDYELEIEWYSDFTIQKNKVPETIHEVKASLGDWDTVLKDCIKDFIYKGTARFTVSNLKKLLDKKDKTRSQEVMDLLHKQKIIYDDHSISPLFSNKLEKIDINKHLSDQGFLTERFQQNLRSTLVNIRKLYNKSKLNPLEQRAKIKVHIACDIPPNWRDSLRISYQKTFENDERNFTFSYQNFLIESINVYDYPTGKLYCPIEEIDTMIMAEIKEYRKLETGNPKIRLAFVNLCELLNNHITQRHNDNKNDTLAKNDPSRNISTLTFRDLINMMEKPEHEDIRKFDLKSDFNLYFDDFEKEVHSDYLENEGTKEAYTKFKSIIVKVNKLPILEFLKFCKSINPHQDWERLGSSGEFIQRTALMDVYFQTILDNIYHCTHEELKANRILLGHSQPFYLPTTIDAPANKKSRVIEGMLTNSTGEIIDALNEVGVIITRETAIHSLYDEFVTENKIGDIGSDEPSLFDPNQHKRFFYAKKIRLISMQAAQDELNSLNKQTA